MNEALHFIRKAILTRLTDAISIGGSYVPVYNRVPSDASEPYIRVFSVSNNESDFNATSFISECVTRLEVVTAFDSDSGGELQSNQIVSSILNLVRTRSSGYYDLSSDGFKVITCTNGGVTYFEDDLEDKTYFRAIVEISNKIEKI
jgi:hypothetical protein|tara:strand:+ start:1940 stop:2377 length:438 start_codon:yes stop_codon:yes gene_type:complete